MKIFLLFILISCSQIRQKQSVTVKGDKYTSPDGKVEIELLIEKDKNINSDSYIGRGLLKAGSKVPEHTHRNSDEYLYFIKGAGDIMIAGKTYHIKDGTTVFIPKNTKHSYSNKSQVDAVVI